MSLSEEDPPLLPELKAVLLLFSRMSGQSGDDEVGESQEKDGQKRKQLRVLLSQLTRLLHKLDVKEDTVLTNTEMQSKCEAKKLSSEIDQFFIRKKRETVLRRKRKPNDYAEGPIQDGLDGKRAKRISPEELNSWMTDEKIVGTVNNLAQLFPNFFDVCSQLAQENDNVNEVDPSILKFELERRLFLPSPVLVAPSCGQAYSIPICPLPEEQFVLRNSTSDECAHDIHWNDNLINPDFQTVNNDEHSRCFVTPTEPTNLRDSGSLDNFVNEFSFHTFDNCSGSDIL